jgi:hypothetical protein
MLYVLLLINDLEQTTANGQAAFHRLYVQTGRQLTYI